MRNIFKFARSHFFTSVLTFCFCFTSTYQGHLPTMAADKDLVSEQPTDYSHSCKDEDKGSDIGPILHAWCWTFKDVIKHLPEISEAGYKGIQISPVQKEKPEDNRTDRGKNLNSWYLLYQPLNFKIGNCLGTRDEFIKMCKAAHETGLKIIVDIVANHLAEGCGNNQGYFKGIDPELLSLGVDNLFHKTGFEYSNYSNRFEMTQKSLGGLPDVNTGNKKVQDIIISFLSDLVKCGADGFRFDAVKHIELPKEFDGDFGSDFWPNVIGAVTRLKPDIYIYGETLQGDCTNFNHYLKYMKITDTVMGWSVIHGVTGEDTNIINVKNFPEGWDPKNFVTWVESHDMFISQTAKTSHEIITLGWALIASRKGSVPLFLARPDEKYQVHFTDRCQIKLKGKIGEFSTDPLWKDEKIAAINKFRKVAADKNERVIKPHRFLQITFRENVGAVIVNLGDQTENLYFDTGSLNENNFKWLPGKDANIISSGGNVKLNGGTLTGDVPARSVCIVYFKSALDSSTVD